MSLASQMTAIDAALDAIESRLTALEGGTPTGNDATARATLADLQTRIIAVEDAIAAANAVTIA